MNYVADRASLERKLREAIGRSSTVLAGKPLVRTDVDTQRLTTDNTIYYGPSKGGSKVVLLKLAKTC